MTPAALLEPLSIEIEKAKFETKQAQGPPRMIMSAEKDAHMEKFITEGLKSNVIRPSNARYYSQVHLVVVKPEADATTIKTDAAYSTGYDCSSNSAQAMLISDETQSSNPQGNAKRKSTTPQASAALTISPKPRKWRTTIDYRHYNDCCGLA